MGEVPHGNQSIALRNICRRTIGRIFLGSVQLVAEIEHCLAYSKNLSTIVRANGLFTDQKIQISVYGRATMLKPTTRQNALMLLLPVVLLQPVSSLGQSLLGLTVKKGSRLYEIISF